MTVAYLLWLPGSVLLWVTVSWRYIVAYRWETLLTASIPSCSASCSVLTTIASAMSVMPTTYILTGNASLVHSIPKQCSKYRSLGYSTGDSWFALWVGAAAAGLLPGMSQMMTSHVADVQNISTKTETAPTLLNVYSGPELSRATSSDAMSSISVFPLLFV